MVFFSIVEIKAHAEILADGIIRLHKLEPVGAKSKQAKFHRYLHR